MSLDNFQWVKLIDLFSFMGLLLLIATGILLHYSLPPQSGRATIWGLTRHQWGDVHFVVAVGFLCLITCHLFLHLKFIKGAVFGRTEGIPGYRLAIGVTGLVAVILLLLAPALSPVQPSNATGQHKQHGPSQSARSSD